MRKKRGSATAAARARAKKANASFDFFSSQFFTFGLVVLVLCPSSSLLLPRPDAVADEEKEEAREDEQTRVARALSVVEGELELAADVDDAKFKSEELVAAEGAQGQLLAAARADEAPLRRPALRARRPSIVQKKRETVGERVGERDFEK